MNAAVKISTEDWDKVIKLASLVALEEDDAIRKEHQKKYLRYMRYLKQKYGEQVDLMASTADFYDSDKRAIKLLKSAYKLAIENNDHRNCVYIADSMLSRLIEERKPDLASLNKWLIELENNLKSYPDKDYAKTYKEYKKRIASLEKPKSGKPR